MRGLLQIYTIKFVHRGDKFDVKGKRVIVNPAVNFARYLRVPTQSSRFGKLKLAVSVIYLNCEKLANKRLDPRVEILYGVINRQCINNRLWRISMIEFSSVYTRAIPSVNLTRQTRNELFFSYICRIEN